MSGDRVQIVVRDGVRTVSLHRPPANAITFELMLELKAAFVAAAQDWDTKVVVLESAIDRFFSAGADRSELGGRAEEWKGIPGEGFQLGRELFEAVYRCPVPVISKVRGIAVGAGVLLPALGDMIVCSESASFGLFELKAGVVGGAGIMRRLMSEHGMRSMMWDPRLFTAREVVELGGSLILVPDGESLDERVDRMAADLSAHPSRVLRNMKSALNETVGIADPVAAYAVEAKYTAIEQLLNSAGRALVGPGVKEWE